MCCIPAGSVVGSPETQLDRRSLCRASYSCAQPACLSCPSSAALGPQPLLPFRATSATGVGDISAPKLLSLTFAALFIFASAAESRVLHSRAVREAPAEDSRPRSHHCVSGAQAKPTLTASLQPWVEGMKVRKESSATPSSAAASQTFGPVGTTLQPHT